MLLITRKKGNGRCLCFLIGERVYDCHDVHPAIPESPVIFALHWRRYKPLAQLMHKAIVTRSIEFEVNFIEIGEAEEVEAFVWPEK